MFSRLLAQSGLSLDRLRALVEVGACGSIVRAAEGDPARQSQYSRQIKELEEFFQVALVERHGKGVRLTARGRELARISRFFLLGLSSFQRGCLAEGQTYRVGASATFINDFLLEVLATREATQGGIRFTVEVAADGEIERRLQELTLDFGLVTRRSLSRPLQARELGRCRVSLWVPRSLGGSEKQAARAFEHGQLPLALAVNELPLEELEWLKDYEPTLACGSFAEARKALGEQGMAAILPEFLDGEVDASGCFKVRIKALKEVQLCYRLAWNPRLLRLNPQAVRRRDSLISTLTRKLARS